MYTLTVSLNEQQFRELKAILNPDLKLIPEIVYDLRHFQGNTKGFIKDLYDHYGTLEFSSDSLKLRELMTRHSIYGHTGSVLAPIISRGILTTRTEGRVKFYRFQ